MSWGNNAMNKMQYLKEIYSFHDAEKYFNSQPQNKRSSVWKELPNARPLGRLQDHTFRIVKDTNEYRLELGKQTMVSFSKPETNGSFYIGILPNGHKWGKWSEEFLMQTGWHNGKFFTRADNNQRTCLVLGEAKLWFNHDGKLRDYSSNGRYFTLCTAPDTIEKRAELRAKIWPICMTAALGAEEEKMYPRMTMIENSVMQALVNGGEISDAGMGELLDTLRSKCCDLLANNKSGRWSYRHSYKERDEPRKELTVTDLANRAAVWACDAMFPLGCDRKLGVEWPTSLPKGFKLTSEKPEVFQYKEPEEQEAGEK
jgi:hypothetical protein